MNVLVSGGGIAGLAAAWWLERGGAKVTVLERAAEYRPLGHYIALKSHGVHLIKQMGLYEACRSRAIHAEHLKIFASSGDVLREADVNGLTDALDGYIMFKRADLHAELYGAVRERVSLRFGASLDAVEQDGEKVHATIAGQRESFDLLLGCDGVHSRTRDLQFSGDFVKPLGGTYVAMNIAGPHGLDDGTVELYLGEGQTVFLIPGSSTELTVMAYYGDGPDAVPQGHDTAAMKRFLVSAYVGFPAHVLKAFEMLDEKSFVYRDVIARIEAPSIVKGRVALIGDAAHCPTFLSGMGSSLALQGAHALGAAIGEHGSDVPAALAAYERVITPIAHAYHLSAKAMSPLLLSRSHLLGVVRNAVVKHTPQWVLANEAKRFYRTKQPTV